MELNRRILKGSIKHLWLWRGNRLWIWVESVFVTLLVLFFCQYFNPSNPLYMHGVFPWPWIAGVVVVLQYGFGPGLASAFMITIMAFLHKDTGDFSVVDFQGYLLSGLSLLFVCVIFSTNWLRRTINAEEVLVYTNERLDSLSTSYYMLRLSYDYLEQNIITKPYTLRSVMTNLHQTFGREKGELTNEITYQFLQVLTQYCSINVVGMYLYQNKKLCIDPIAQIGPAGQLDINDPLIKQSVEMNNINYVTIKDLETAYECNYLASIPMVASDGVCLGFVVIKDMSFWTLHHETLTTLAILITYFVEDVTSYREEPELFKAFPDCPSDFARQLKKLIHLYNKLQIESALCAVMVPKTFRPYNVIDNLQRQRRFLDNTWTLELENDDVLITLVPFTSATGIHGFFSRISAYIKNNMGLIFADNEIKMRSMQIYQSHPSQFITSFMTYIRGKSL